MRRWLPVPRVFECEPGSVVHFRNRGKIPFEFVCVYLSTDCGPSDGGSTIRIRPIASTIDEPESEEETYFLGFGLEYRVEDKKDLPLYVSWRYTTSLLGKLIQEAADDNFNE